MSLHWTNDLPLTLTHIARALRPDAPFLAAMPGGDTLFELRGALQLAESERRGGVSPRVSPLIDVRDVAALLQRAGFGLVTVDVDDIVVDYPDVFALVADLGWMGEGNAVRGRLEGPVGRDVLMAAQAIYSALYGNEDGTLPATFRIINMVSGFLGGGCMREVLTVCRLGGRRVRDSRSRSQEGAGKSISRMSLRAARRSRIVVCVGGLRGYLETNITVSNNELFYVYIYTCPSLANTKEYIEPQRHNKNSSAKRSAKKSVYISTNQGLNARNANESSRSRLRLQRPKIHQHTLHHRHDPSRQLPRGQRHQLSHGTAKLTFSLHVWK